MDNELLERLMKAQKIIGLLKYQLNEVVNSKMLIFEPDTREGLPLTINMPVYRLN